MTAPERPNLAKTTNAVRMWPLYRGFTYRHSSSRVGYNLCFCTVCVIILEQNMRVMYIILYNYNAGGYDGVGIINYLIYYTSCITSLAHRTNLNANMTIDQYNIRPRICLF